MDILYYCFQVFFDSLYSLITHYQQNPLVSPKFSITLGRAVPPPNQHEGKPWFHPSIKREQAWLPDGDSRIFRIVCVWPFGLLDYGSATLRCRI